MKRWLPFPLLSAVLAACWLLLAAEISVAHILLAALLAVSIISPLAAARLILLVTWDIVLANVAVARLVLGPTARLRPAFIHVPLALSNPQSIALLASIITMTPGTVSSDIDPERRTLLVHVLDCADAEQLVADIKHRYEEPLLEIFGC
jgi:multicomponent K+:H+ antiporter subunit E